MQYSEHFIFYGNVQGVGFRFRAAGIAADYPIGGWIRNLPNRSVEMEIWGDKSSCTAFLDELLIEMGSLIHRTDRQKCPPVNKPLHFEIRH